MNTCKSLVSVLMLVSVLLSACASAATQAPTALPTQAPPTEALTAVSTFSGDPIPEEFLGVDYTLVGGLPLVIRFRTSDDPRCLALKTQGNCFTMLRSDNPSDPGARGPAVFIDGLLAVKFQKCLYCASDEIDSIEYFEPQEDGGVLVVVKCETKTGAACNSDVGTIWKPMAEQTTVSPNLFKIPISITFGPDWSYSGSALETITLNYRPSKLFIDFIIVDNSTLLESSEPPTRIAFPDDFAGYLQSNDFWSEVTPANPVIIGGVNGYQIDAIGKSLVTNRAGFLTLENSPHHEFIYPNPQRYRFFFFDNISGSRLLIVVSTDHPDLLSIAQFDAILPEVQEVLDTVTFGG